MSQVLPAVELSLFLRCGIAALIGTPLPPWFGTAVRLSGLTRQGGGPSLAEIVFLFFAVAKADGPRVRSSPFSGVLSLISRVFTCLVPKPPFNRPFMHVFFLL